MALPFVVGDSVRFNVAPLRAEIPLVAPMPIGFNANSPMTVTLADEETGMVDCSRDGVPFSSFHYLDLVKVTAPPEVAPPA